MAVVGEDLIHVGHGVFGDRLVGLHLSRIPAVFFRGYVYDLIECVSACAGGVADIVLRGHRKPADSLAELAYSLALLFCHQFLRIVIVLDPCGIVYPLRLFNGHGDVA